MGQDAIDMAWEIVARDGLVTAEIISDVNFYGLDSEQWALVFEARGFEGERDSAL